MSEAVNTQDDALLAGAIDCRAPKYMAAIGSVYRSTRVRTVRAKRPDTHDTLLTLPGPAVPATAPAPDTTTPPAVVPPAPPPPAEPVPAGR